VNKEFFEKPMETMSARSNQKQKERALKELGPPPPRQPVTVLEAYDVDDVTDMLRRAGGNLNTFLSDYMGVEEKDSASAEAILFKIYNQLAKDPEAMDKWNEAIERSYHVRMKLAKAAAFDKLLKFAFTPGTPAADISWIKVVLGDEFIVPFMRNKLITQGQYGPKMMKSGEEKDEDIFDQLMPGVDK
jgi:hypothetical protein